MKYVINIIWDNEAGVWVAVSDDIAGLVLESGSFDALLERVRFAAPELLNLNHDNSSTAMLTFISERTEQMFSEGKAL